MCRDPDTSFVVIAYNEERAIRSCLASIQAQQGSANAEIIVVDDGSTDATVEIVRRERESDSRIRLLALGVNRGRGYARATGIAHARAQEIATVDGDVVLPPDWLDRCRSALAHHDAVSAVAVPDGDVSFLHRHFRLVPRARPHTVLVAGGNALYRRSVFEQVAFDDRLTEGEDVALNHAMMAAGLRTARVPDLLVEHRESKGFAESLRWLYQSGKGAARQFHRYRQVRLPDLAFATQLSAAAAAACGIPTRRWKMAAGLVTLPLVAVAAAHVCDRFEVRRPDGLRLMGAVATDMALIASYQAGRLVGHLSMLGERQ